MSTEPTPPTDANTDEHQRQTAQGVTFFWAMVMAAGFVVLFGLTQWGILDDVADLGNRHLRGWLR